MKINHKLIKNIIMGIGIGIFIISLIYKIRNLILYGGTSVVDDNDPTEQKEEVNIEPPSAEIATASPWADKAVREDDQNDDPGEYAD
jgi:hypothetical protein